ncbi:FIG01072672: hypothetical protein [Tritonibacter mobilis]|nr:hypothetical protein [Tritonibacter mobilis]PXW82814.1 hypothetical protein BZA02_102136 [Ruegeria sp. P4]GLP86763.1 hypothetical protein GCM10007921_23230 [Tritonibacter mobilis]SDX65138.1 hypothetical protein SAMN05444385_11090 [Tritonibacter mobilis]VCU59085.1 FIG01072672: hypothetical protein [Tritonibacter mobilis]
MGSAMIGVVVWADTAKSKAVIWCEDQRDLAYYMQQEEVADAISLQKGDLVEFESRYESGVRMAGGVQVVEPSAEPSLAEVLRARKRGEQNRSEEPVDTAHQGAEVATLSIPERCSSRVEGRRSTGERKSAKILPFPELLRA